MLKGFEKARISYVLKLSFNRIKAKLKLSFNRIKKARISYVLQDLKGLGLAMLKGFEGRISLHRLKT